MINIFKRKKKEASRLVGLDIALKVSSFVTGKEHLHYGLWEKLDVTLENLGKAQEAYTNLLFKYFLSSLTTKLPSFAKSIKFLPSFLPSKQCLS